MKKPYETILEKLAEISNLRAEDFPNLESYRAKLSTVRDDLEQATKNFENFTE